MAKPIVVSDGTRVLMEMDVDTAHHVTTAIGYSHAPDDNGYSVYQLFGELERTVGRGPYLMYERGTSNITSVTIKRKEIS